MLAALLIAPIFALAMIRSGTLTQAAALPDGYFRFTTS